VGGARGSANMGTPVAPYQATTRPDGSSNIVLQSITAMPHFQDQSHEELRWSHRRTNAPATHGDGAPRSGGGRRGGRAKIVTFRSTPVPVSGFPLGPAPRTEACFPPPTLALGAPLAAPSSAVIPPAPYPPLLGARASGVRVGSKRFGLLNKGPRSAKLQKFGQLETLA
jgi:hypothetical protein